MELHAQVLRSDRHTPRHAPARDDAAPKGHLVVRSLSKQYHDHHAVQNISVEIHPGEFVALLGPSGCGKTTLLRCIAGLVQPSGGDILMDGQSIAHRPVHERGFGMVFQSYALFPHMSVLDNVAFPLRMRGQAREAARKRAVEALQMVQMASLGHRMPAQLSGGQQQRVALARAVVARPRLLLLDEPFSALDAKLREAMQLEVRELQRTLKVTTIFVTHDQTEAMVTADRIAVLNAGRVEQFDSPVASYDRPASLFVADFIGRMNRLPGKVLGTRDAKAIVSIQGVQGEASGTSSTRLAAGQPVIGVLRPERTRLVPPDRAEGPGLQGTVREVIFVGEKLAIFVDTAIGSMVTTEQNSQGAASTRLKSGDPVRLEWSEADLLLFPVQ